MALRVRSGGVRRFQNKDGSYTKRGLARYNESVEKYRRAESGYKEAKRSGDKQAIRTTKAALKSAKEQANHDYNRLKNDSRADKGKELYKSWDSVKSTYNREAIGIQLASTGALVALRLLARKFGDTPLWKISWNTIAIGATALNVGLVLRGTRDVRNLREFERRDHKSVV